MKKLFILIAFVAFVANVNAQVVKNPTLRPDVWFLDARGDISLDTTSSGDSVLYYNVLLNKAVDVFYDVQIELDSVSGTPNYDVDLKGKVFESDSWTDLETDVTWDGETSDTTILFQEHSTAVFMRYLRLEVNGQAGTGAATVDRIGFKIWWP